MTDKESKLRDRWIDKRFRLYNPDRVVIGFCKDCEYWGKDASQICCSQRMRVCNGLVSDWEMHPEFTDGTSVLVENAAVTQEFEICENSFYPKFMTGPLFGCVNFKPK